jgi:alpha-galactosidase
MLHAGGWQSWSPGWELFPGETLPAGVRLIPLLRLLTAAPWELGEKRRGKGRGPALKKGWVGASFIIYLRAGDWYLVLADERVGAAPAIYAVSPERRDLEFTRYEETPGGPSGSSLSGVRVFCVRGFFALKDSLRALYQQPLPEGPDPIGGYESWYNRYTRINEKLLLADLEALLTTDNLIKLRYVDRKKPAVFQIDDGWERAVGDWEIDTGRFPRGLRPLAEKIKEAGLTPGLWLAPFLVTRKARIFREKPQWLLRDERGGPVKAGWNPNWDGVYYCLDISLPGVLEYLRLVLDRVIDQWGFRYIKLDFLYAGFLPGLHAVPLSAAVHYERACAVLTERKKAASGEALSYLGCGLPLGPSFRYFPLSRIGADTRESWDWPLAKWLGHLGRPSAYLCLRNTLGRSFLNGTVYKNDPDVIFLRSKNCRLRANEKELIALVNFLLAAQIMFSDDPRELNAGDLALTGRINALYDRLEEAGDEYGAVQIGRDLYRLISRSTGKGPAGNQERIRGLINLGNKRAERDGINAAPHSIALYPER